MSEPYSAQTIARWFLAWSEDFEEAQVSNLKLQKLLYYAQGHYIAEFGKPLFSDEIEAWSHGPVVSSVYHNFKQFGNGQITLPETDDFKWSDVDRKTSKFLSKVWNTYGSVAAWKLRDMTHQETPWQENFNPDERHKVIPRRDIQRYFTKRAA